MASCFVLLAASLLGLSGGSPATPPAGGLPSFPSVHFEDVTAAAKIHFVHNSGAFGKRYLPETMGSGCAFLDYDNDGKPDILLVNGADFPGHRTRRTTLKLYHNNGDGTFTDVTARS